MKIEGKEAKLFKIRNRKGYAIVCCDCLTEGKDSREAYGRMVKALRRTCGKTK